VRRPGSIGGRLRTGFALLVILIAAAGTSVYAGFAHQEQAIRRLNGQIYVLRRVTTELDAAFDDSQLAIANYQLTFEMNFTSNYYDDTKYFSSELALMRAYAPSGMRGLVNRQAQAGTAWFAIADTIIASPASSPSDTRRTDRAWAVGEDFASANDAMLASITTTISNLIGDSNSALGVGLAWSGAALAVAIGLALAVAVSTVRRTTGPLRSLTATVNRLTVGDHRARARASGAAEIQQVALAVNALADESDQLRATEAERARLRAVAQETGSRIREYLHAEDMIRVARAALEQNLGAEVVCLYVLRDGRLGPPEGLVPGPGLPGPFLADLPPAAVPMLENLLRNQSSAAVQDVSGPQGRLLVPQMREPLRQAGVVAHLITPFGGGDELLGAIAVERLHHGQPWTEAEIHAVELIAADLGRGLHHARLHAEETHLVQELKSVDRAKSDFIATVSHELRTPLNSITGYVEMLLDRDAGQLNPEQERMLGAVSRNAGRLQALIEDLLTQSGMDSGTFRTDLAPTNMRDIIAGAGEDIQPAAVTKGVTLTAACPADGLVVAGDAHQLSRVMTNLLSNAVKFTPAGGRVQVTADAAGGWVVIRVADNGIGIPEADKKDLFTRFFRASNAAQRAIPGTGLGLAIAQTIIAGHGGDLAVESEEGRGTTVSIRLPLAGEGIPRRAGPEDPAGRAAHRGAAGRRAVQAPGARS
jgi:two-component system, OmpR family, phosphate regulon sensor histidine kinase PhoR